MSIEHVKHLIQDLNFDLLSFVSNCFKQLEVPNSGSIIYIYILQTYYKYCPCSENVLCFNYKGNTKIKEDIITLQLGKTYSIFHSPFYRY